jgi:hypothetical protein
MASTDIVAANPIQQDNDKKKFMRVVKWKHLQDLASRIQGTELNPHDSAIAWLLRQLHLERIAFSFALVVCIVFLVLAKVENADLRTLLEKPYAYIVPSHILDVIKLRANTVPDEAVFSFAEDIATRLGNTNWEDVEDQYNRLQKYMHPTLKARFAREMRDHIKLWQGRHIDQKFTFQRPAKYDRKKEQLDTVHEAPKAAGSGAASPSNASTDLEKTQSEEAIVFTVEIWGTVKKYVDGRATDPYREKITLKFTTNNISADRWWLFELTDIQRESSQEIEDAKLVNPQGVTK